MSEGEGSDWDGPGQPENQELMLATARTLANHGIARLTTQRVANEWGKSQSLVHYYYQTKDDLIIAFINFLREQTSQNYEAHEDDSPKSRVEWVLKRHFEGVHEPAEPEFSRAIVEIQRHAAHNERSSEALGQLNADAKAFLKRAIQEGIEEGVFRDVDVEVSATFLLSAVNGGIQRVGVFEDENTVQELLAGLDDYIETMLCVDSQD